MAGPLDIARAVEILRRGGLVGFPTETVYGLGADALNPDAVARIFRVKGRPVGHPLIVHLANAQSLAEWAAVVPRAARLLADAFWPGPLTLILRRGARVPDVVTGGQGTVGVRVPSHPVAHALLDAFGGGIAAPSANRFGRLSPTRAEDVRADLGGDVDLVLEGGSSRVGIESTIVDVSRDRPELLRPGHITSAMLSDVVGEMVSARTPDATTPRAPGTLDAHYAPLTPLELLDRDALQERLASAPLDTRLAALIIADEALEPAPGRPEHLLAHLPADPEEAARALYATLRRLDAAGVARILVERPPPDPRWDGVRDRLRRAAATFR